MMDTRVVQAQAYIMGYSGTALWAEHRNQSSHEENADSSSHPSTFLTVVWIDEGSSDTR